MIRTDVTAVIVTYNRLALLRGCVESVRAQVPRPGRIIVVDNGSTDGTAEWLATQGDLDVTRQTNCGSAGAYHTAFAAALGHPAPWIWGMDDDGRAEPGALAELLTQAERHDLDLVGPIVVAREDPRDLAFPVHGWTRVDRMVAAARDGVVRDSIALFNGSLLHRRVFETIGNMKREMFIWGDEWEFTLRARRAGLKDATAVAARHIHPRTKRAVRRLAGGWLGTVEECPEARQPFYFRNMGYIDATYEKAGAVPLSLLKHTAYFLGVRRDPAGLRRFWASYLSGMLDRYPEDLRAPPSPLPLPSPSGRESAA